MGLFDSIHKALANEAVKHNLDLSAGDVTPSYADDTAETSGPAGQNAVSSISKPILLLNSVPVTIDPKNFSNPLSNSNPQGSLTSLWAFRELVDPVPSFTSYYSASGSSTETNYSLVVNNALAGGPYPFSASVIAESQFLLSQSHFANIDGTPGTWAPIYATPGDWYDTSTGRYLPLGFDLQSAGTPNSPFDVITGEEAPLTLQVQDENSSPQIQAVGTDTKINQISLKYLQVSLNRPWWNQLLFSTNGWFLAGQDAGFCSSGSLTDNSGVLALLPTSIIFATDVSVDAQWGGKDQAVIDGAVKTGKQVSLGPFVLNANSNQPTIQVLGWVTQLIPYSPKLSTP
jgi:hypothetical protein